MKKFQEVWVGGDYHMGSRLWTDRQIDTDKNITFPQTTYAGRKNIPEGKNNDRYHTYLVNRCTTIWSH